MKALLKVLAEGIYRDPTHDWGLCLWARFVGLGMVDGMNSHRQSNNKSRKEEGSGFGCPKGLGFGTPPHYKI